ncbi:MAG: 2-C-methyl-D-erythritol 2,4-cyclodiphosphate synthase [Kiritimatiellae bacterium]|nr:2-C-methyl-D-erythritol 2,4-cyclodiphosphate synthase [Kiritimatiellia bacterium]
MRIGFGYDSHRFAEGRRLVLGGVEFPGEPGLEGHSDADALLHSVIDALLGAAALGDIGSHFPDGDPKWRNADSAMMLKAVVAELASAGFSIGNIDATVVCERPKLSPKIGAIRERLAELLEIPVSAVSVKGKTNERMDAIGAGTGLAAYAVALVFDAKGTA